MPAWSSPRARELALMISRWCNIECRHCGIESSPRLKDHMPMEDARRYIIEASMLPDLVKITFTGGEPFMRPDELEELIGLCHGLRLATRVVTNGFWAKSPKRGLKMLQRMKDAGLSELNFSADKFHLEFLDKQTLHNAIGCAQALGYAPVVSFVSTAEREPLDDFSRLYDIPLERLRNLRHELDSSDSAPLDIDFVHVFYGGLIGLGRAETQWKDLRFLGLDFFSEKPCREVVNKPVIYPDGSFQACCCAGGKIASFTVGNGREQSVEALFEAMHARAHFRLINTHGPRTLYDCVRATRPDLKLPTSFTSICELCVRATAKLTAAEADEIAEDFILRDLLSCAGAPTADAAAAPGVPAA